MKGLSFLQKIVYILNVPFGFILLISYLANYVNPSIFAWMGLLGLAFPIWFVINLLFVAFWMVSLKKQIFFSIFCLAVGFYQVQTLVSFKSRNKVFHEDENKIKVMSYNVRTFHYRLTEGNWHEMAKGVRSTIIEADADIVCLQEYLKYNNMPIFSYRYKHIVFTKGNYGLSIFSKHKIIDSGKQDFPDESSKYNKIIWADILLPNNDTVRVINTHLKSIGLDQSKLDELRDAQLTQDELEKQEKLVIRPLLNAYKVRGHQARVLGDFISESPHPIIFCGDLNDTPGSYAYRKVNHQLDDCFMESGSGFGTTVPTFKKYKAPLRIDHIMCSPYFTSYNYEVLNREFSDHYPVIVDLKY